MPRQGVAKEIVVVFLHVKSLNQFHFTDQVNFRMIFNTCAS